MPSAAQRYSELGFRVVEGGKSGKLAVLKTPAIAEIFGVRHDNVLSDVRKYQERLPLNLRAKFSEHCCPTEYRGARGREPCFELTKVGLSTIAAKYDEPLRFLLALAFDALEHDEAGDDVIRQINQRIRELRSRASGQDELTLEAPAKDEDDDLDDAKARRQWHLEAPLNDNEATIPNALKLDRWIDNGWPIRIRYDSTGNPLMVWLTSDDAITTIKKWMITGPNGKQVMFCFSNPYPPIEVVLRTYHTLGHGDWSAAGTGMLRHYLAS